MVTEVNVNRSRLQQSSLLKDAQKTLVVFTMYERYTAFPTEDNPSRCQMVYDIIVRQERRCLLRSLRFTRPQHPKMNGGLISYGGREVTYWFFSKVGDLEQDPYHLLTKEFFQDIKSQQLYKRGEKVEKMETLSPILLYQNNLIDRIFGARILCDIITKLNANPVIQERFEFISTCVNFGHCCYGYLGYGQTERISIGDDINPDPQICEFLVQAYEDELNARERARIAEQTTI